jgi:class 3 adenylate cyclase
MTTLNDIHTPTEMNLLVAFFDLARFTHFSRNRSAQEIFEFVSAFYEFVGDIIEDSGGTVVKFMGDAALIVYPETHVNEGVLALKALKDQGDVWLAGRNIPSRNIIKIHFGPVICGPMGTRTDKRFDVFGETVNIAALLKSNGLAMSPQVFRKLNAANRKLFKKHTPPITYIPVTENHKD